MQWRFFMCISGERGDAPAPGGEACSPWGGGMAERAAVSQGCFSLAPSWRLSSVSPGRTERNRVGVAPFSERGTASALPLHHRQSHAFAEARKVTKRRNLSRHGPGVVTNPYDCVQSASCGHRRRLVRRLQCCPTPTLASPSPPDAGSLCRAGALPVRWPRSWAYRGAGAVAERKAK